MPQVVGTPSILRIGTATQGTHSATTPAGLVNGCLVVHVYCADVASAGVAWVRIRTGGPFGSGTDAARVVSSHPGGDAPHWVEQWIFRGLDPSTTYFADVQLLDDGELEIGVTILADVDQVAPVRPGSPQALQKTTTSGDPVIEVAVPSADGDLILSTFVANGSLGSHIASPNQTVLATEASSDLQQIGAAPGAANVTVGWIQQDAVARLCSVVAASYQPPQGGDEPVELAPAEAAHAHAAESPALAQAHVLGVASAAHGQAAEEPALAQSAILTAAGASHGHTAGSPALAQAHVLAPLEARHGHEADAVSLTQAYVLAPADGLHAHAAEAPVLLIGGALAVDDATHGHAADGLTLTQANQLVVQAALHLHTADSPPLSVATLLAVADALHAHAAEAPALVQAGLLVVANALHAHLADAPGLSQASVLAVADALHGHTADSFALGTAVDVASENRARARARSRIVVLDARSVSERASARARTLTLA